MQTILVLVFLLLAIGFFVLSYTQFREKSFLWNNAYLLASQKERQKMDSCKDRKRPHYRQSGDLDWCGTNYFTPEQTAAILKRIEEEQPPEYQTLLSWFKAYPPYNGFYVLGL